MINSILKFTIFGMGVFLISSCFGEPCIIDKENAPSWVCTLPDEKVISSVGIAKMNSGNDRNFQRKEALASGRSNIVDQIRVKVVNTIKNSITSNSNQDDEIYNKKVENISKQIAYQTLNGSRAIKSWYHPETNELYLLVVVKSHEVEKSIERSINKSFAIK
jgi:hypothetical protein